jgi:hypothetical protein
MGSTVFAALRRWSVCALGRNVLVRTSDRIEALAGVVMIMFAALAVPWAASVGNDLYADGARVAAEQARSRHRVEAVAVEASMPAAGKPAMAPRSVRAQWRYGSQTHDEVIRYPQVVASGAQLTIWVDDAGVAVVPPMSIENVWAGAVTSAVFVWLVVVSVCASLGIGLGALLDRFRARQWELELQLLANNDDGWANRHI